MHTFYRLITDTGDLIVTFPLALTLIVMLTATGARRSALAMAGGLLLCFGTLGLLKLVFVACGDDWHAGLRSPSGHTGMSTYVYGCYALVLAHLLGRRRAPLILVALALVVVGIGGSRLALHNHTPIEVAVGLLVGINSLLVFARYQRLASERGRLQPWWLFSALLFALLFLHGNHAQAEGLLYRLARTLRNDYGVCMVPIQAVAREDNSRARSRMPIASTPSARG